MVTVTFLASLFKCFLDTTLVIGGPSALSPELHSGLVEATKRHLSLLPDKRKAHAAQPAQELRCNGLSPEPGEV